jgi:Bifunctional DNA primase/polymerase, N-terminal
MSALLNALGLGLPCFPCKTADKTPLTPHGFRDASGDRQAIKDMFGTHRSCLVAVPTGRAAGIDVLDIDPRSGGLDWYDTHKTKLPPTRVHHTRSGGLHLLFRHLLGLRNSAGKIARGVDVRADGGYIIWWPASGFDFDDCAPGGLPEWPLWLLPSLFEKPRAQPLYQRPAVKNDFSPHYVLAAYERELSTVASAHEGSRNTTLHRAAIKLGTLIGAGALAPADVEQTLCNAAKAAGLPWPEAIRTIRAGIRYGADRPRQMPEKRRRRHG